MKLTKDYVERLKARWDKHQVSESGIGDLCDDNLAMRKMIADAQTLMRGVQCPCEGRGTCVLCKLKELLGVTDD